MTPDWEKRPWSVEITRNSMGMVSRVRVLAAEPRRVNCTTFQTKADRVGRREIVPGSARTTTSEGPAVVCDCGIVYAGLAPETLLAHGDLIAAAPELYEALAELLKFVKDHGIDCESACMSILADASAALAKARGEATTPEAPKATDSKPGGSQ